MNITINLNCSNFVPNFHFGLFSIFTLIISVLSIFGNIFIFYILYKTQSFHSNVRFLLKQFTLASVIFSFILIFRASNNISIWIKGYSETSRLICIFHEMPWEMISATITSSISLIGLERVISTICKRTYFDSGHPSHLTYSMVMGSWLAGFGTTLITAFNSLSQNTPVCYCSNALNISPSLVYSICVSYLLIELATFACYCILFYQSKSEYFHWTINTSQHSLAQRHQLLDNMQTSKLLAPILLAHGATYTCVISFAIYTAACKNFQIGINCVVIIYMAQTLENLVNPILIVIRHEKMRKAAIEYFPFLRKIIQDDRNKTRVTSIGTNRNGRKNCGNQRGIVEFRMEPENHEIILHNLWNQKTMRSSGRYEIPGQAG